MITDIRLLPNKETPSPFDANWQKVSTPISPRGENLYLWYYRNQTLGEMTQQERSNKLITEIDITYGDDRPWYGFEKLDRPAATKDESKGWENVWLTVRKGVKRKYYIFDSVYSSISSNLISR